LNRDTHHRVTEAGLLRPSGFQIGFIGLITDVRYAGTGGQMRVLLVNPPQLNIVSNNIPSIVDEERGYNPPLGLLYVAAYARENTGHNISVLDAVVDELDYPEIKARIAREKPDVVGVTATTFTLVDAMETVKAAKEVTAATVDGDRTIYTLTRDKPAGCRFPHWGEEVPHPLDNLYNKLPRKVRGPFHDNGETVNTGNPT
jgi:hypothetical protein